MRITASPVAVATLIIALFLSEGLVSADEVDSALLEAAREGSRAQQLFRFVVEQAGQAYQVNTGETVRIEPAPFTLWVVFLDAPEVLVNASTGGDLYDPIVEGIDLTEALEGSFDLVMGMAEYSYNLDHELFVVPLSSHYLSHPSAGEHRFNRAVWHTEYVAGGRDVDTLTILSRGGERFPLQRSPVNRIYVSGIYAPWGADYSRSVEDAHAFILEIE